MKQDWKKTGKLFYLPALKPDFVEIPPFRFFSIKGQGDPNEKPFQENIAVLYSLAYAVKMSPKKNLEPMGYFDYTVYPLEGVWDLTEEAKIARSEKLDKSQLVFNLMIRQPDFVTEEYALETIERTKKKKFHPLLEKVRFDIIEEGSCVQMMHIGSYDSEPGSFRKMEEYCTGNGYRRESKQHREIYLSDFRKVSPEKLKTVLRFRVSK
jgi:hypothetical protein